MHTTGGTRRSASGFTLIEMMVALGILVFGLTALAGVLGVGVDTRRSAERLTVGAGLVGRIVHELERDYLPRHAGDSRLLADEPEAALAPVPAVPDTPVPGSPGMTYSVTFDSDEAWPEMVLAHISVRWRQQGETQGEEFLRLLRRAKPLGVRRAERENR